MSDYGEICNNSSDDEEQKIKSKKIIREDIKNDCEKKIGDYLIKDTIGKGTFSTVKLGEHIYTKQKVAIKILNKEKIKNQEDSKRIEREIKFLSMMNHPNIIKTYEISETCENYYIIMEFCDGGELFEYIVKKEKLEENEASMFFYQLINALEYIHSLGIAHRDLKPENLLLLKNKQIKIIDFGLSNYFNGDKNLETPCGSPSYASPEIIKGESYNGFNIDIWASGIILFAMLCGYLPFDEDEEENEENEINNCDESNHSDNIIRKKSKDNEKGEDNELLYQKIMEGIIDYPSNLSDIAVDLMKKILVVDPSKRIQIKDIKKHPFYLLGKNNYNLNQNNILPQKTTKKVNIKRNKETYIDNEEDISNKMVQSVHKCQKKKSSNSVKNLNHKKKDNKKILLIEPNKRYNLIRSIIIKKDKSIRNEMEEYEKKLFENYLKNVKDSINNRRKKKCNEKNNGNKIIPKALNTINASPVNTRFSKNIKLTPTNKNNYTLNQIFIDFNSKKNIFKTDSHSLPKKYNYNYIYNFNSLCKINQTIRKNFHLFNKNTNYFHNENNSYLNKGNPNLLTVIIPDNFPSKKRNNTENKLLNDIKHYITENYKKKEESKKQMNYLHNQKINSIDQIFENIKNKSKKSLLPTIRPNLFNIRNNINVNNSSNHNNIDSSLFSSLRYLKTEETNKINNRKRLRYNNVNKNDYHEYQELWNNSNYNVNNRMKYKLCFHNYKKPNISYIKGL